MEGENKRSRGKISSLPRSISAISVILESGENRKYEHVGPTPERPGPTFDMQATEAVMLVIISIPFKERMSMQIAVIAI